MSLKLGNFCFWARTALNWLRMGKYGTYLEFYRSQEAPKHCPTFDSLTQSCARAHFRLPPVCPRFAPSLPPVCPQFDWHCISVTDFFQTVNPYFWNNSLGYHQCAASVPPISIIGRSCQGCTQYCELLTCVLVSPTPQVSVDKAVDKDKDMKYGKGQDGVSIITIQICEIVEKLFFI